MLFNWLYARHTGGRVVLRFEDTDRARSTEEAIAQAEDVLRWLGIDWDDGPHRQTQRLDLYAAAAADLVESGAAYPCYCTAEELTGRARAAPGRRAARSSTRAAAASLTAEERAAREAVGLPHVIRLAMPADGHDRASTTSCAATSSGTTRSWATTSSSAPTGRPRTSSPTRSTTSAWASRT